MITYWCEHAVLDGAVARGVTIEVDGSRIASVAAGTTTAPAGAHVRRGLTMPGLANAHSHAFHRALRHRTQVGKGSFWTWRDVMYAAAGALDPDSYYRLARATYAEMVLAGVTVVGEFHYVHHRPDGGCYDDENAMGEAVMAAARDAGLRITLLDTLYLHGGLDGMDGGGRHHPLNPVQERFSDGSVERWAARVDALEPASDRVIGAAIHSVRAVDRASLSTMPSWLHDHVDTPVHVHVSEQPSENEQCLAAYGRTPTQLLADSGVLGGRTTAVHATHASNGDITLLGRSGAGVCLCPTTERDLADGIGRARCLADAGVALSLGSDSHAVVDLFEEARAVELDERLATGERGIHDAGALLTMATRAGHRALGWPDGGVLQVGAPADLVTIGLDSVRLVGATPTSMIEAAVFAATAADVTDVVIGGRAVVEGGQHMNIDVASELRAAIAAVLDR